MTTIPQLSAQMKHLLGPVADQLGRDTGFIQRQRCFSGSSFARTLVFAWWANPAATCDERAEMATLLECPVSASAIEQRFTPQAAEFLQRLLGEAVRTAVEAEKRPAICNANSARMNMTQERGAHWVRSFSISGGLLNQVGPVGKRHFIDASLARNFT